MHAYFMVRGKMPIVEDWKCLMQGQAFSWVRKNLKTGKDEMFMVQGALRPIEFFEYVFPEEHLDTVLINTGCDMGTDNQEKSVKALGYLLRKATGASPPPKIALTPEKLEKTPFRLMRADGCAVSCLGIKKDEVKRWEEQGYEQEML